MAILWDDRPLWAMAVEARVERIAGWLVGLGTVTRIATQGGAVCVDIESGARHKVHTAYAVSERLCRLWGTSVFDGEIVDLELVIDQLRCTVPDSVMRDLHAGRRSVAAWRDAVRMGIG